VRLHAPSPPQGKNNRALLFSLLPPHIQYSPPQSFGAEVTAAAGALVQTATLDALVQTGTLDALVQTGTL
jgi:hypothetical protein